MILLDEQVLAGVVAFEVAVAAAENDRRAPLVAVSVDLDGHAVDGDCGDELHSADDKPRSSRLQTAGRDICSHKRIEGAR